MQKLLLTFSSYVSQLENDSSSISKVKTLKEALQVKQIADLIWWTYNPYKKFNISSSNCKKLKSKLTADFITDNTFSGFIEFLSSMAEGKLSGHAAISKMLGWVEVNRDCEDILYRIIDKDLKCRANVSLINKAKGSKWIPEFNVALAEKYEEKKDTIDEDWLVSRKLDGCRCLCICTNGNVQFFSRQGIEFLTLGAVTSDIQKLYDLFGIDFVLDGEICLVDSKGNEDFQGIMKQIRKKDHTIPNPKYKIFDFLTWDEFNDAKSKTILSDRIQRLLSQMQDETFNTIEVLEQVKCTAENLAKMQDKAKDGKWEGLIARKNCGYKGKRSRDMLKLKKFHDAEYVVENVELGEMRIVEGGKEKTINCLTAVYIKHEGYDVKVGSGFDVAQRQHYFAKPKDIIGKTICVQYFEVTHNQEGGISLRFPTVKHIYENGRNV